MSRAGALHELCEAAGLAQHWQDYRGEQRRVAPESLRAILAAMELPCAGAQEQKESLERLRGERAEASPPPLLTAVAGEPIALPSHGVKPGDTLDLRYENGEQAALTVQGSAEFPQLPALALAGYHRLALAGREVTLALAPPRAYGLDEIVPERRLWGLAAQIYSLRRADDGGIGDFSAAVQLAERAAAAGADALALSPVHAQFAADPSCYSPYAPSTRLFLNELYADPAAVLGAEAVRGAVETLGIAPELQRLESASLVDWPKAAQLRRTLLRALFEELRKSALAPGSREPLAQDYAHFVEAGAAPLRDHARFEALHAEQYGRHRRWHWRDWPAPLRDAGSREVEAFAARNAEQIAFHAFVQWLADRSLAKTQVAARAAGMKLGLVSDLAVGTHDGGSHAWSRPQDLLMGLSVGAPPDEINRLGQSWGLTTFSPRALRLQGYAPFIAMLRASLRHAGGLRIDHVLGLNRLWLVPEGAEPTAGAYLKYPLTDLLRLIALESWRHRALIVGEDLGTVPAGFQEALTQAGLMGMRVLWFEREYGLFRDPVRWPAPVVAMTSTHDVPPVAGWWQERDIDWRLSVRHLAASHEAQERTRRAEERRALWAACVHARLVQGGPPPRESPQAAVDAALRFVARTPARLALIPLEDLAGLDEQPNLPGTLDEHPNWRRRLPLPVAALFEQPAVAARLAMLRGERP